jgi:hypothetical protein
MSQEPTENSDSLRCSTSRDEIVLDIAKKLQSYYDGSLGTCVVTVGVGDEVIYLYEHTRGRNREVPDWAKLEGVVFRFEYVGKSASSFMKSEVKPADASLHPIVIQPRIKLHFDPNFDTFGYWWIEVSHLPAIGAYVIPFENDQEDIDWEWDYDCVEVVSHLFFVERALVCVFLKVDGDWNFDPPTGFDEAMLRAGWKKGDAGAWS